MEAGIFWVSDHLRPDRLRSLSPVGPEMLQLHQADAQKLEQLVFAWEQNGSSRRLLREGVGRE